MQIITATFRVLYELVMPYLPAAAPWLGLAPVLALFWFIGRQLRHPSGWFGRFWIAPMLNSGNRKLLDASLKCLDARSGERVADIGFGGGYAIDQLIPLVKPERPIGVEVSEMLVELGGERWDDKVEMYLAAVSEMPLSERSLDAVLTVNTIYFWSDPVTALKEIRRVLKPEGRLVLAVGKAWAMRLSPITWFSFRLYSENQLRALLGKAGFDATFEDGGGGLIALAKPTPPAPK